MSKIFAQTTKLKNNLFHVQNIQHFLFSKNLKKSIVLKH